MYLYFFNSRFEFNDYHVIGINIKNKIILLQSYDI
jgi:hypothetical protein